MHLHEFQRMLEVEIKRIPFNAKNGGIYRGKLQKGCDISARIFNKFKSVGDFRLLYEFCERVCADIRQFKARLQAQINSWKKKNGRGEGCERPVPVNTEHAFNRRLDSEQVMVAPTQTSSRAASIVSEIAQETASKQDPGTSIPASAQAIDHVNPAPQDVPRAVVTGQRSSTQSTPKIETSRESPVPRSDVVQESLRHKATNDRRSPLTEAQSFNVAAVPSSAKRKRGRPSDSELDCSAASIHVDNLAALAKEAQAFCASNRGRASKCRRTDRRRPMFVLVVKSVKEHDIDESHLGAKD